MLLRDFTPDRSTGILVPAGVGAPAGYLDGAEELLLSVLTDARDLSVASEELQAHIRDWPTQYHLTPYRSTILDCFGFRAGDARVLELGAGCGAITRWLGEHCATVHAIEGSVHRARVARARCADLDHVSVYSANYSELAEHDAFDVVTLIGVLEYGHLYHPLLPNDPAGAALDNLRIARRALHDDGLLVLAIENRMGIKYLNGAREDHSGKHFEGVQGYPHATSAVTFSARHLRRMLADAGFGDIALYLPYPDYKLATTIVNAEHAGAESGAYNWLPGTAPDRGSIRGAALYHESLAEREFTRAGLLPDLANSFLMLAYAGDRARSDQRHGLQTDWRARHYALDRRPGLGKRVTIAAPGDDVVRNEPVLGHTPTGGAGALEHRLEDETLEPGDLLVFDVHAAIAATGFDQPFLDLIAAHRDWLVEQYATGWVDRAGIPLLDGEAFDACWWNIVCDADGHWSRIDREWRFRWQLPLDYVLWRTFSHYAGRFALHLPPPWRDTDQTAFADHWVRHLHPELDADRPAYMRRLEMIEGQSVSARYGAPPAAPAIADKRVSITGSIGELCGDRQLLAGYVSVFGPEDPVIMTLLVEPQRAAEDIARLREALDDLGVAEDRLPDLLVGMAIDPMASRRATSAATAVLTRQPTTQTGSRVVPHLADAGALRQLAEERWAEADNDALPARANSHRPKASQPRKLGVVLTYNDDDIVGDVIDHLLANNHDLVVWDNGSQDGTWDVLRARADELMELRRVSKDELGLYDIYGAMSQHIIDCYVTSYDWVSWPDSDEILLGDDLSVTYGEFTDRLAASSYDWVQFRNWNFWWTEIDDSTIASPIDRVRHYALFPDCAPRIRAWRADRTNERVFNHNPVVGTRFPTLANLCHYPMRGPEQANKKLLTRAGIQRGESNWHYNKMQREPSVLRIPAAKLCELPADPRTPGPWTLRETAFQWRNIYDH